jgi:hypothetical protein
LPPQAQYPNSSIREFIVSRMEASQEISPYVYIAFTDPTESKSASGGMGGGKFSQSSFGINIDAVPIDF